MISFIPSSDRVAAARKAASSYYALANTAGLSPFERREAISQAKAYEHISARREAQEEYTEEMSALGMFTRS